ncbi:hypothetical protein [Paraburkholderia silvatlantica]|uniref:hypothetical protein n=1 Tax=Paraburkholderia silvatlantica TaxID=321895 RepID=UPI0037509510
MSGSKGKITIPTVNDATRKPLANVATKVESIRPNTASKRSLPNPARVAGKVTGCAKLADFQFQDLRDCN